MLASVQRLTRPNRIGHGSSSFRNHGYVHQRLGPARALRPGETPDQARERRLRESARVEERVIHIEDEQHLREELRQAGNDLVVLEIQSETLCQTGLEAEPELQWRRDQAKREAQLHSRCTEIKHTFQRIARECPDVKFLSLQIADGDQQFGPLLDSLGVEVLPTLQFYRNGAKVWQHRGVLHMEQDLGEGVLYYGDTAGNGIKATDYVYELRSRDEFYNFINSQSDERVLTVINVALLDATPCVHVFPAVLALAKNFVGYAVFARILGDNGRDMQQLLQELRILEVPTFLFYRGGKEVGRHVGSSRADLIGQILQQQANFGVAAPVPIGGTPRRRGVRAM